MDKVQAIRQQKRQLKQRILKLQGQKVQQSQLDEKTLALLLEKKQQLEHRKLQHEKYRKMEQEYHQRQKQMQRQKQLERIRNQKRMIELEVGMKKIVLNGVQQKVKGMNSQQLMTRAFLTQGGQVQNKKHLKSKLDIKNEFEKYLQTQNTKKEKKKYDVFALNEKRFQIFEKKEEMVMRQVLLKELLLKGKNLDIDVMNLTKEELSEMLEQQGVDIEQYMQPAYKQQILNNYELIQRNAQENIKKKQHEMRKDKEQNQRIERQKQQLKKWVSQYQDRQLLSIIQDILQGVIDEMATQYEKRHFEGDAEEKKQRVKLVKKQYEKVLFENQAIELAEQITRQLCQQLREQALLDVAEETCQLNLLCHEASKMAFDWAFTKADYLKTYDMNAKQIEAIQLNFVKDVKQTGVNPVSIERKVYAPEFREDKGNVFETQKLTAEMVNDLKLLTSEQEYFEKVGIKYSNQIELDERDPKMFYQNQLFIVTLKGISRYTSKGLQRKVIQFDKELKDIKHIRKFNQIWIIHDQTGIFIFSGWNTQAISFEIGQRINNMCGFASNIEIFPVFSFLGSVCSLLIGFEKGQTLKYNLNRNRITNQQTNITLYIPLGQSVKTGDQPAFPLNNRNQIQFEHVRAKQNDAIHQFRQFFQHHTAEIIALLPYKTNTFITIDKNMKCAIWIYESRRGIKSYEPLYDFELKCNYKVYKQSDNPRFKDLFPSSNITETPQQLFDKYMQQESFLQLQIYNNPKKSVAYFKSPQFDENQSQQPVWRITYDEKKSVVQKIFQTFYNIVDGKVEAKMAVIWREYIVILVERQHAMRHDLKTMKIYTWNIETRKLLNVAIEFDTFKDQKQIQFAILENYVENSDFPLIAVLSSGKVLIFSLLSGQLLKNLSEQSSAENSKFSKYHYSSIVSGQNEIYALSRQGVVQINLDDKNVASDQQNFAKVIDLSRKKYTDLI